MNTPMTRTISICADDIGQDVAIDRGCLQLFKQGRLTAVSALSSAPHAANIFQEWGMARAQGLQIGLHFNLTLAFEEKSSFSTKIPYKSLPLWLLISHLHLVSKNTIRGALIQQIAEFEDKFGHAPDFIDGHQHVHQLPVIQSIIIETIVSRFPKTDRPWVRNTLPPMNSLRIPDRFKCLSLSILGGFALKRLLKTRKIPTNNGFLGVYSFNAPTKNEYRVLMRKWLSLADNGALMMCHPADSIVKNDAIGAQRPIEFAYLSSEEFKSDLAEFGIHLASFTV